MTTSTPTLFRTRDRDAAEARRLHRRHRAGLLVRVVEGVYTDSVTWRGLTPVARHLLTIRAIAPQLRQGSVLSHRSAALVHGWPLITLPPDRVHVRDPAATKTEHRAHLVRHPAAADSVPAPQSFAGVAVTSVVQTALDLTTTLDPAVAAVAIDHAVRRREMSVAEFTAVLPSGRRRGAARARMIVASLDPAHESAGESYTSIRMVELGLPTPRVQHVFRHADGTSDRVDFWLPELGVVVEFDGKQKYADPALLDGREPGDVVWREKIREDRLRSQPDVRTVVRPTWWHLVEIDRLRALFRDHRVVF